MEFETEEEAQQVIDEQSHVVKGVSVTCSLYLKRGKKYNSEFSNNEITSKVTSPSQAPNGKFSSNERKSNAKSSKNDFLQSKEQSESTNVQNNVVPPYWQPPPPYPVYNQYPPHMPPRMPPYMPPPMH